MEIDVGRAGSDRSAWAGPAAGGALLVGGILAVAFNMRSAITSLPPVFPELSKTAGLSTVTLAVLAAVPVLGFAAFSGVAPAMARRLGEERVVGLALVLVVTGLGLRSAAPIALLFPGTIIASLGIALMNVLLPSLIKRRRPDRAGLLIGLYLLSLTAGAVLGAAIAVPIFTAVGGGSAAVRLTLGVWAVPAVFAVVAWIPQCRFGSAARSRDHGGLEQHQPPQREPGQRVSQVESPRGWPQHHRVLAMGRYALAWQVTAFMGLQSMSYYAIASWFPTMLRDHGISAVQAGNLLALLNLGNAITGLIVPVLAQRARDQRLLVVAAVPLIAVGLIGSALGPKATVVEFACLLGFGQGSAFGLGIYLVTARAADGQTAAALSGFAQGIGYLIAASGPVLLAWLHAMTGGWTVPVLALVVVAAGQLVSGLLAGRAKTIGAAQPTVREA